MWTNGSQIFLKVLVYTGLRYRSIECSSLQKRFWAPRPPTMIRVPPFFGDSLSIPYKERGTNQTNPNFWGLQRWFWRANSAVRFPPTPKNDLIRFGPPPAAAAQNIVQPGYWVLIATPTLIFFSFFLSSKCKYRVHAKGVVLCEMACFCLLSTF